jgi:hypothetical protein
MTERCSGSSFSEVRKSELRSRTFFPGIGMTKTTPVRPNLGSFLAFRNLYQKKNIAGFSNCGRRTTSGTPATVSCNSPGSGLNPQPDEFPSPSQVMWGKTQDHGDLGDKQSGCGMRT